MAQLARDTHYEFTAADAALAAAKDTAINRVLDMAEEMMIELRVNDTINSLLDLPSIVRGAQQAVNAARAALEQHKANALAGAKERYDLALLEASLEAPQDGKNAEARERQFQAYLAGQSAAASDVRKAGSAVHSAETETRRLEQNLAWAEADLDNARNRLRATLSIAELQSAVVRATRVS